MSPRGSFGFASSATLKPYCRSIEYSHRWLTASRSRLTASSGRRHASVSAPWRPPHKTKIFAPSAAPKSIARIVFCSAYARTRASFAVNAPSRNTGSKNRFTVAIGTTMPWRSQAHVNSLTMRSRSEGVASIGTRSLSCRLTPHAPTSPSIATAAAGASASRTTSPNGSRPRLPTVHSPNENLSSGRGVYASDISLVARPAVGHRSQRRIHASVVRVPIIHGGDRIGLWRSRRAATHGGVNSFVNTRPDARAHSGQDRRAERCALVGDDRFDGPPVHVRLNLAPQRRPRAAAAADDALNRYGEPGGNRERAAKTERDAFEHRAHDVAAAVIRRKADTRRANVRIAVRRPFAHQIPRPQHAVGARRHARGFGRPIVVGDAAGRDCRGDQIAQPPQRQTGGLRHAHDVPPPRHGVTERVDPPPRIGHRPIGRREHDA